MRIIRVFVHTSYDLGVLVLTFLTLDTKIAIISLASAPNSFILTSGTIPASINNSNQ